MKQKNIIAILIIAAFLITLVVVLTILFVPKTQFQTSEATMAKVHACLQEWTEDCGIVFADEETPRCCMQLMSISEKDNCFSIVAITRGQELFCLNIVDKTKRQSCKMLSQQIL